MRTHPGCQSKSSGNELTYCHGPLPSASIVLDAVERVAWSSQASSPERRRLGDGGNGEEGRTRRGAVLESEREGGGVRRGERARLFEVGLPLLEGLCLCGPIPESARVSGRWRGERQWTHWTTSTEKPSDLVHLSTVALSRRKRASVAPSSPSATSIVESVTESTESSPMRRAASSSVQAKLPARRSLGVVRSAGVRAVDQLPVLASQTSENWTHT